ncbi:MAG: 2-C-methyl-D-erythritol 2,4-cyclodiphosphate synthase [FCB group bacterium]|jgi:2-C-methyl-D-erythritol 2,4-cyclodiphosphate synthase
MVGFGYDSHKLVPGRKLLLGGVLIESESGAMAHSDGDTLLHALCDALLGAAGLGDIGELFPDSEIKYKDADSKIFVKEIIGLLKKKSLNIVNIDVTILLEKPKLNKYKQAIRQSISELCKIPFDRVNIKAKTNEGMGFVGHSEGIAVYCICEIQTKGSDL